MAKDKRLWIDCVAGSQLKDTQGEILNVEGADISELQCGRGRINADHGKGFWNSLGRITEAKKIFTEQDCEDERHKYYWDKIKAPYIYCRGVLYNDEDHQNAKAAAAILRNIHKTDSPLKMKASVEGGVLARGIKDANLLANTKIHSVALTFTPANNATLVEPLNLDKTEYNEKADYELIKSVMHLAKSNVPSFRHITRTATANKIINNLDKIERLAKDAGIDLVIKRSTAEQLVEKAVKDKIRSNIEEINKAIKDIDKPKKYNSKLGEVKSEPVEPNVAESVTARDKFQQQIGRLKTQPDVPKAPQDPNRITAEGTGSIPIKSAKEVMDRSKLTPAEVYAKHSAMATQDPAHLDRITTQLKEEGATGAQIEAIVRKLKGVEKSNNSSNLDDLGKALSAGYGGAGAPTNVHGGNIFQAESLEKPSSNNGFKYITCDKCGKEQIQAKHQVKCRSCGKNFSLTKVLAMISKQ